MSLSDCEHCWDSPCTCGWGWRHYSAASLSRIIKLLTKIRDLKREKDNRLINDSEYMEFLGLKPISSSSEPVGRYSSSKSLNSSIEKVVSGKS